MPKKITLLDCTLRDGSYVVDYQFTPHDTATIALGLEQAGAELIEIGHGLGMNASNRGYGVAAATDAEYLKAARRTLKKAKFGMFYIPGIARLDDIRLGADLGMRFIRIGTNVTEVEQSKEAVSLAKKLGLAVSANLMKTYALTPEAAAEKGRIAETLGADVVAIVDSAGGMFPDEVHRYVEAMKARLTRADVGIHAHNNLQMAVINSVAAAEAGASCIDACLQGLGRSAGNAPIEILAMILEKRGFATGLDAYRLMDLGERLIQPILKRVEYSRGVDVASGIAQFHSSFLKTVTRVAAKYGVDARDVINGVSEFDRVNVSEELAESVAKGLRKSGRTTARRLESSLTPPKSLVVERPPRTLSEAAKRLAVELRASAGKAHKPSVFTVALSRRPRAKTRFPYLRENASAIIGNLEYATEKDARDVLRVLDGAVDVFMLDTGSDPKSYDRLRRSLKRSRVMPYSDDLALARAAVELCIRLVESPRGAPTLILGVGTGAGQTLAHLMAVYGFPLRLWDADEDVARRTAQLLQMTHPLSIISACGAAAQPADATIIIGIGAGHPVITQDILHRARAGCRVLDAGIGTLEPSAVAEGLRRNLKLYRLDMRAGLSGEITSILDTEKLVQNVLGRRTLAGVAIVAGGVLGRRGEVIVDSISRPSEVLGLADGRGGLLDDAGARGYKNSIAAVRRELFKMRIS